MWAIIKFKENNFETLKKDLRNKLGYETQYYFPKIETHKYCMNKLVSKKVGLLGNYVYFVTMKNLKILASAPQLNIQRD